MCLFTLIMLGMIAGMGAGGLGGGIVFVPSSIMAC